MASQTPTGCFLRSQSVGLSLRVCVVGGIHPFKDAQLKLKTAFGWTVAFVRGPLVANTQTRDASEECIHLVTGLVDSCFKVARLRHVVVGGSGGFDLHDVKLRSWQFAYGAVGSVGEQLTACCLEHSLIATQWWRC